MRRKTLKSVPFGQIERRLAIAHKHDHDEYIHLGELKLVPGYWGDKLRDRFALRWVGQDEVQDLRFHELSILQYLNYLGIPSTFASRISVELAMEIANRLMMERADELALLRLGGKSRDEIRAILRPGYCRFSDIELFDVVKLVSKEWGLRATDVSILFDCFHLRLVTAKEPLNVSPGRGEDLVFTGVDVYNSETGHGRLRVRGLLFRQVCSNGLTIHEGVENGIRTRLDRIDGDKVKEAFSNALKWCAAHATKLKEEYRSSHGVAIEDPEQEIANFLRRYSLGSPNGQVGQLVMERLRQRQTLFAQSRFDIVQALTEVSQQLDVRHRLKVEDAVGAYMLGSTA